MDSLIINSVMAYIGETNTTIFTLLNNMVKNGNSCIQYCVGTIYFLWKHIQLPIFFILLQESFNFDRYDFVIHFNLEIIMHVSEVIVLSVSLPLIQLISSTDVFNYRFLDFIGRKFLSYQYTISIRILFMHW